MAGWGSWLNGLGSFVSSGEATSSDKAAQELHLKNRGKLEEYHKLAQEALDRAYKADVAGRYDAASKLYGTACVAAREGLQLAVGPSTGLGPIADSVVGWRADLEALEERVMPRVQAIKAGTASSPSAPPPVRPTPYASVVHHRQQQQHLQQQSRSTPTVSAAPSGRPPPSSVPASRPLSAGRARPGTSHPAASSAPNSKSVVVSRLPSGAFIQRPATGGKAAAAGSISSSRDDGLAKYKEIVAGEILDRSPSVQWDDIAGLATAKAALTEAVILPALRPDLFQGLRAPVRGILLYGPPGNGKTMLAKALASESRATFFNISASSLTSKWVGDGEKLVRAMFEVAAERQPSIIFMDELDSLLGARGKAGESDAARRLMTEFLVQFDGVGGAGRDRVVVVGATNRPQELDDAVRRRLSKRIFIPLPDADGRRAVLAHLLKGQPHALRTADLDAVVRATAGYSASDLAALCKEAAMAPLREVGPKRLAVVPANALRPISARDFAAALEVVRPSVDAASLRAYEDFTRSYGTQ